MTAPKSPAFQFYPHDFLAGRVATYAMEEVGAYMLLLAYDWSLDGLPLTDFDGSLGEVCPKLSRNSAQTLAKLCRTSSRKFERIWATIGVHFVVCADGRLRNPRLQAEREKQLAYSQAMSENGRRGGRPRKPDESRGLAAAKPRGKPDESTPSPTPSPNKKSTAPWAARLGDVWREEFGSVTNGHIGAALTDAMRKHGPERVERAMRAYIAVQKADNKPAKPKWFAEQSEAWIKRTETPLTVIDGEMSPSLELLTRPKATKAS